VPSVLTDIISTNRIAMPCCPWR